MCFASYLPAGAYSSKKSEKALGFVEQKVSLRSFGLVGCDQDSLPLSGLVVVAVVAAAAAAAAAVVVATFGPLDAAASSLPVV